MISPLANLPPLKQLGHTTAADDSEVTKVLESLVADNEALKRDAAELQNILAETREDMRVLQEEIDERRAQDPSTSKHHRHTSSLASSAYHDLSPTSPTFRFSTFSSRGAPAIDRRSVSMERPRRVIVRPSSLISQISSNG